MNFSKKIDNRPYSENAYNELKEKSIALQETEEKYRIIFENASDIIVYTGSNKKIVDVNLQAEEVFGFKPEEMIGNSFKELDFLSEISEKRLSNHFNDILVGKTEEMLEIEFQCRDKEGYKFVEINSKPVRKNHEITGIISIIRDITKRKRREEVQRKNEEKFKIFFENANDGIVYLDNDAVIRASNKKIEELFGYTRKEVIGKKFTEFDIFHPSDMKNTFDLFQESIEGELPPLLEFEGFHRDGKRFYLEINPTLIKEDEEIIGMLAIIRDTTTRKTSEEERERLIDIIEATPDFIFTYDANGKLSYINRAGKEVMGLLKGDALSLVSLPNVQDTMKRVIREGAWKGEAKFISKKNTAVQVSQVVMSHRRCERDEPYYSMIMRDITDQKQNEKHIKHLTHQLIKVQEDERLRISRDLHDNLAQDLSSLKILCETLFDFNPEVPNPLRNKISGMSEIFQRSIDSVRDLTYNLRPASLDQLGLVNTIYQYCEEFHEVNEINVEFYSAGMKNLKLDFDTEINIYRIVQEALNNTKKHADANSIKVNLISSYPTIILQIEDNGSGFELKRRKKELLVEKRMGLKSIEERVGLLGGTFRIQSKRKLGTRIHVEVPYKERMCDQKINCRNH